jgi:hypothetical protein
MDLDQLAQELAMLKEENMAAKQEKRLGGFIDKYGTKFNGNTDIANLILAEMDRRGVSEASEAASEAVQSVLDKLREEATRVLDETKGAMEQISDLVDKIDDIQQSVDAAKGGEAGGAEAPPDMGGEMPPAEGAPLPDAGAPPAPGDAMAGAAPAPDMGGGAPPAGGGGGGAPPPMPELPPDDAGGGPPPMPDMGGAMPPEEEAMPPAGVPSDVRLKNIKGKFAAYAKQRKTVPSDQNLKKVWKPRAGTLDALRRGL